MTTRSAFNHLDRFRLSSYLCVLFLSSILPVAATIHRTVEATFAPPSIAAGDHGAYVVTITQRSNTGRIQQGVLDVSNLPNVPGLQIGSPSTRNSSRTNIINQAVEHSVSTEYVFPISPTAEGSYTLPAWSARFLGEVLEIPAANLTVNRRTASDGPSLSEQVFFTLNLPETLYVGQTIPLDLNLYIEEGVDIAEYQLPLRTGDGFAVSDIPREPRGTNLLHEGRNFRVFNFELRATPVRSGNVDLEFTMPLVVSSRSASPSSRNDLFGNSFFDRFFESRSTQRLTITTGRRDVQVLPLPRAGRPASFTGAIGNFEAEVSLNAEQTKVGEPINLSLAVQGTGNFDRISAPRPTTSNDWQVVEGESSFHADDSLGLSGVKVFNYTLIPRRPGEITTPPLRFSHFDPERALYFDTDPLTQTISVAEGNLPQPPPDIERAQLTVAPRLPDPLEALLTPRSKPGDEPFRLTAPLAISHLVAFNGALGLSFTACAIFIRRRHRLKTDASFAQRVSARKAARQSLRRLAMAERSRQAGQSLEAALSLIRASIAAKLARSTEAWTHRDLLQHLERSDSVDEQTLAALRSLFQQCEAIRYSGSRKADTLTLVELQAGINAAKTCYRTLC